jgi:hypothetical protein
MFVTAANRALNNNGLFERAPFAKAYAKAELKPHSRTVNSLSSHERDRQKRRINQAITSDMDAMVEFDLFATTDKKYVYRITDEGERIYEQLQNTPVAPGNLSHADGKLTDRERGHGYGDPFGNNP